MSSRTLLKFEGSMEVSLAGHRKREGNTTKEENED